MSAKYVVTLTEEERTRLIALTSAGRAPARMITRARILLKADASEGGSNWSDEAIREALDVSLPTIHRVREEFVEASLETVLQRRKSSIRRSQTLDGEQEAHLIALACSTPPAGRSQWTMQLLADKMVDLAYVAAVSDETVRRTLKKTSSSRG